MIGFGIVVLLVAVGVAAIGVSTLLSAKRWEVYSPIGDTGEETVLASKFLTQHGAEKWAQSLSNMSRVQTGRQQEWRVRPVYHDHGGWL